MLEIKLLQSLLWGEGLKPSNDALLITGPPGSGKSTVAFHLAKQLLENKRASVLYYNTDEPASSFVELLDTLEKGLKEKGMTQEEIDHLLDKNMYFKGRIPILLKDAEEVYNWIELILHEKEIDVLILDSINNIGREGNECSQRCNFKKFRSLLKKNLNKPWLGIFVVEKGINQPDLDIEFLVDTVIDCQRGEDINRNPNSLYINLKKVRRQYKASGYHEILFTEDGISIIPNLDTLIISYDSQKLKSGHPKSYYRTGSWLLDCSLRTYVSRSIEEKGIPSGFFTYIFGPPFSNKYHLTQNIVSASILNSDQEISSYLRKLFVNFVEEKPTLKEQIRINLKEMAEKSTKITGLTKCIEEQKKFADKVMEKFNEIIDIRFINDKMITPERCLKQIEEFIKNDPVSCDILVLHDLAAFFNFPYVKNEERMKFIIGLKTLSRAYGLTTFLIHTCLKEVAEEIKEIADCILETGNVQLLPSRVYRKYVRTLFLRGGEANPNWYHGIFVNPGKSLLNINHHLDAFISIGVGFLDMTPVDTYIYLQNNKDDRYINWLKRIHKGKTIKLEKGSDFLDKEEVIKDKSIVEKEEIERRVTIKTLKQEQLDPEFERLRSETIYCTTESSITKVMWINDYWLRELIKIDCLYPLRQLMEIFIPGWLKTRPKDWYEEEVLRACYQIEGDDANIESKEIYTLPLFFNPSVLFINLKLLNGIKNKLKNIKNNKDNNILFEKCENNFTQISWNEIKILIKELKSLNVPKEQILYINPSDIEYILQELFAEFTRNFLDQNSWPSYKNIFRAFDEIVSVNTILDTGSKKDSNSLSEYYIGRVWFSDILKFEKWGKDWEGKVTIHPVPSLLSEGGYYFRRGWYVGMLQGAPNTRYGAYFIRSLVSTESSHELYLSGYGLPARNTFYENSDTSNTLLRFFKEVISQDKIIEPEKIKNYIKFKKLFNRYFLTQLIILLNKKAKRGWQVIFKKNIENMLKNYKKSIQDQEDRYFFIRR